MTTAALFVRCGKKLNAAAEQSIRGDLLGKRFAIQLSTGEVDDKQSVTDAAAVEKKIEGVLKKAAPDLFLAKGLDFKQSIKTAGDVKLMVKTENEKVYSCTLQLKPPPPRKAVPGSYTLDQLVRSDFSAVLSNRALKATVDYTVNHPEAGKVARECDKALAGVEKEFERMTDAAVAKTVAKLQEGLESKGSGAMSWDTAKKLVDGLNREVQRLLNALHDASSAALVKAVGGSASSDAVTCSVVAMFSKFEILGGVYFPGGGKPLVSEKSLKSITAEVVKLDKMAKGLDAKAAALVAAAGAFCTAHRKATEADKKAAGADGPSEDTDPKVAAERIGKLLRTEQKALQEAAATCFAALGDEYKRAGNLAVAVDKIGKLHEKDKPKTPEAKEEHVAAKRELDRFRKQTDLFEAVLAERLDLCDALQDTVQAPRCFGQNGAKAIADAARTVETKGLVTIAGKLADMCDKAVETLE